MYNIKLWKDHVVSKNNTYSVKQNTDGTITLTPAGEVLQQGTNMSATNFNNMELGIADVTLASMLLQLAVNAFSEQNHGATSISFGTEDLTAGVSKLESGKLYFVWE